MWDNKTVLRAEKNYLMWKVGCLDDPHRALVPIDGGDAQVLVSGRVARVDRDARCGCLDGERQENEEGDGGAMHFRVCQFRLHRFVTWKKN